MSAPAAKAGPSPRITIARTSGSASKASSAATSSSSSAVESALRRSGRFRTQIPTCPSTLDQDELRHSGTTAVTSISTSAPGSSRPTSYRLIAGYAPPMSCAIGRTDLGALGGVVGLVDDEPGHAGHVLRAAARLGEHGEAVRERASDLSGQPALGERPRLVPADLPRHEDLPAAGRHTVRIAVRSRPALRIQVLHGLLTPRARAGRSAAPCRSRCAAARR